MSLLYYYVFFLVKAYSKDRTSLFNKIVLLYRHKTDMKLQ